jgi:hypothetical protein
MGGELAVTQRNDRRAKAEPHLVNVDPYALGVEADNRRWWVRAIRQ